MFGNSRRPRCLPFLLALATVLAACVLFLPAHGSEEKIVWSDQEKPIYDQIRGLRKLPDDVRAHTTQQLAIQIRQLPVTANKLSLAGGLAGLATEGDFGHDTLQEVANTLASTLREHPQPASAPNSLYLELASLVRYEHVQVSLDAPQFTAAMAKLEADDANRQQADFKLDDLHGKSWRFKDLRGKVVLVNFWATWCPPCRKEMPGLQSLYLKFQDQGFVVLAISDEDTDKINPFLAERNITYPVLLDPERKVNQLFQVQGIPKSFVYDRDGKLVAQAIDMRTQKQFLDMLAKAGLQ